MVSIHQQIFLDIDMMKFVNACSIVDLNELLILASKRLTLLDQTDANYAEQDKEKQALTEIDCENQLVVELL